jgi:hypothetical protein
MTEEIVALRLDRATKIPYHVHFKACLESVFRRPPDTKVASEPADKNVFDPAICQISR